MALVLWLVWEKISPALRRGLIGLDSRRVRGREERNISGGGAALPRALRGAGGDDLFGDSGHVGHHDASMRWIVEGGEVAEVFIAQRAMKASGMHG
jgi:hypothetical protein